MNIKKIIYILPLAMLMLSLAATPVKAGENIESIKEENAALREELAKIKETDETLTKKNRQYIVNYKKLKEKNRQYITNYKKLKEKYAESVRKNDSLTKQIADAANSQEEQTDYSETEDTYSEAEDTSGYEDEEDPVNEPDDFDFSLEETSGSAIRFDESGNPIGPNNGITETNSTIGSSPFMTAVLKSMFVAIACGVAAAVCYFVKIKARHKVE